MEARRQCLWMADGEGKSTKKKKNQQKSSCMLIIFSSKIALGPAGEHLGVVGRTGAGKSTMVSALFRLIELTSGTILIDGHDISQVADSSSFATRL